jgi:hypothetical protein
MVFDLKAQRIFDGIRGVEFCVAFLPGRGVLPGVRNEHVRR